MSKQLQINPKLEKIVDALYIKPMFKVFSVANGVAQVIVESHPMRYMQRKIRPDIPQGEYVPIDERFSQGYKIIQEAYKHS